MTKSNSRESEFLWLMVPERSALSWQGRHGKRVRKMVGSTGHPHPGNKKQREAINQPLRPAFSDVLLSSKAIPPRGHISSANSATNCGYRIQTNEPIGDPLHSNPNTSQNMRHLFWKSIPEYLQERLTIMISSSFPQSLPLWGSRNTAFLVEKKPFRQQLLERTTRTFHESHRWEGRMFLKRKAAPLYKQKENLEVS